MRSSGAPFEILLVEDDAADARLAQIALKESKVLCNVSHVRDGVEAMDYLHKLERDAARLPDLMLLDLNMPRKDGRQVLEEMRGHARFRSIPVVVLTTSDVDRDVASSYSLGANSYVTKPMDVDEFCAVIRGIENYWFSVVKLPR